MIAESIRIRSATPDDAELGLHFIRELATGEALSAHGAQRQSENTSR